MPTTESKAWRHIDPNPHSNIDRIRLQPDGKYVRVLKNGSIEELPLQAAVERNIADGFLRPCKDEPLTSDDELALSMFVFIEQHGEGIIRATAIACKMIADKAVRTGDGTSKEVWTKAAELISQAATHLEEN